MAPNKTYSWVTPILLSIVLLCACDGPNNTVDQEPGQYQNRLRYDLSLPLGTMNPAATKWAGATYIYPLLYSRLCTPDSTGRLQPDLALGWSCGPDALAWTVVLRPDVRFHDGTPLEPADVKGSLELMIQRVRPRLASLVESITLVAGNSLEINLSHPDPNFMHKIWDFEIFPCQPGRQIDFYTDPVGSGPFRFKARNRNRSITLGANPAYHGGRPALDEVTFYYEPDREKTWSRLLAGQTDAAQEISPTNYDIMRRFDHRFIFSHFSQYYYTIMLFNTTSPPFDDLRVRQALTLALDRDVIIDRILRGYAEPAVGPIWVGSPFHDPGLDPPPFDPRKALDLLHSAGWSKTDDGYLRRRGRPLAFKLLVPVERPVEQQVARYIQLALNDLGIRVDLQSRPYADIISRYSHNTAFEAVLTEIMGVRRDPTGLLESWVSHRDRPSQIGGFASPSLSRQIRQALLESNPERQKALLWAIEKHTADLAPGIFLYHKTALDVLSRRFRLPHPFSLDYPGIFRLWTATLDPNYSHNEPH